MDVTGPNYYIDTNVPRNNSFDPFTQPFWITLQDGSTQIQASIADIDFLYSFSIPQAITQGAQLGAAVVLLAAIFLMTKSEKRRSSVFCLNAISLLMVIIRAVFQLATICGPLYEFYRWKTQAHIDMGNATTISAGAASATLLLTIAILASLFVQVRIVCCNLSDARRYIIDVSNAITIATAVSIRLAVTIMNTRWTILTLADGDNGEFATMNKMASAANITMVLAIAFSTVIFTAKLASAILTRRSMGMKQFGPMQIIFVMGCQTMFTPLIFTIITYTTISDSNVQSFVPVIVAVSLPLSGMWAAVNTDNVHIANPNPRKHRVVPLCASSSSKGSSFKKPSTTSTSTYYDDDKYGLTTPTKKPGRVNSDVDLEMQKIGDGVNVERTYSVRSD